MKPTPEQHAVLNARAAVTRINARAGTGKTTTLAMLARQLKQQRILYLVFNRQAREEARDKFPPNTDVLTVHALAYRREGYKWKKRLGHFSPADLLFGFAANEQTLAALSYDFLTYFLNSPYPRLEDAVRPFCAFQDEGTRDVFKHYQQRIIHAARELAIAWNTGGHSCPHDFYLKLFHKSGAFARELDRYDVILVDEGQDLSPVMLDALRSCRKRVVLVGDSHQQIYSFRYAIDAMQQLACDEEFELTHSFRFGETIAQLATLLIQETKQERDFRIRGNQRKTSGIGIYQQIARPDSASRTAVLSRTNVALFENAMSLRARCVPFYFERDLYPMLMKTLDVYWLAQERKEKVRDPLLRSFTDLDAVEEYAETTGNSQLKGMLDIVDRFDDEFPDVIFEMAALRKEQQQSGIKEGVILSTIHSAKGQEYEHVYIDADMAENLDYVLSNDLETACDEVNVTYVGVTRVMDRLHLPPEFQTMLSPRWKNFLRQAQRQRRSRTGKPRVGDYVNTPRGAGTVTNIQGDYCLIDSETQEMKLRERLADVRLA